MARIIFDIKPVTIKEEEVSPHMPQEMVSVHTAIHYKNTVYERLYYVGIPSDVDELENGIRLFIVEGAVKTAFQNRTTECVTQIHLTYKYEGTNHETTFSRDTIEYILRNPVTQLKRREYTCSNCLHSKPISQYSYRHLKEKYVKCTQGQSSAFFTPKTNTCEYHLFNV